eukprot:gene6913-30893_t
MRRAACGNPNATCDALPRGTPQCDALTWGNPMRRAALGNPSATAALGKPNATRLLGAPQCDALPWATPIYVRRDASGNPNATCDACLGATPNATCDALPGATQCDAGGCLGANPMRRAATWAQTPMRCAIRAPPGNPNATRLPRSNPQCDALLGATPMRSNPNATRCLGQPNADAAASGTNHKATRCLGEPKCAHCLGANPNGRAPRCSGATFNATCSSGPPNATSCLGATPMEVRCTASGPTPMLHAAIGQPQCDALPRGNPNATTLPRGNPNGHAASEPDKPNANGAALGNPNATCERLTSVQPQCDALPGQPQCATRASGQHIGHAALGQPQATCAGASGQPKLRRLPGAPTMRRATRCLRAHPQCDGAARDNPNATRAATGANPNARRRMHCIGKPQCDRAALEPNATRCLGATPMRRAC